MSLLNFFVSIAKEFKLGHPRNIPEIVLVVFWMFITTSKL